LHAVGEGLVGGVMDFDEQAVGAYGHGGAGEGQYFVAFAGAVTGVDEDGQVAAFFNGGDDRQIESVAGMVGECAHAAFAEHHVVIAFAQDVFGGHQELVEGGGHAALEEDGFFGAAGALEQREILHVAGADLDNVGVFFDEVEAFVVDGFGDDAEAVVLADLRENFEAVFAEALKTVRGSARFVGAATEKFYAGFLDAFSGGEALLFGFYRARPANQAHVFAAEKNVAARSGNAQDGVFFFDVAADQLVGLADGDAFDYAGDAFDYAGEGFEDAKVERAFVAGDADGGAEGAGDRMCFKTEAFNAFANSANLRLGGVRLHYD